MKRALLALVLMVLFASKVFAIPEIWWQCDYYLFGYGPIFTDWVQGQVDPSFRDFTNSGYSCIYLAQCENGYCW